MQVGSNSIRKVTPAGVVSTLTGSFPNPFAIAVDGDGNLYVTNGSSNIIRRMTPAGVITTLVGQTGKNGSFSGFLPAQTNKPMGITVRGNKVYFLSNYSVWSFGP